MQVIFKNSFYSLAVGKGSALVYTQAQTGRCVELSWPQFEIDGKMSGQPKNVVKTGEEMLNGHICEISARGELDCGAELRIELRVCEKTPIIRFGYVLSSEKPAFLTKVDGENLTYFNFEF